MIAAIADTHAAHWYIVADPRLPNSTKVYIDNITQRGDVIGISAISFIELVYLIEKGRIASETLSRLSEQLMRPLSAFVEIPIDLSIARALSRVDVRQIPDMPDRIIAATALHLNVPLISRDNKIRLSSIHTV
jgi:PIN domain nuclease of toxin-antitoxin system